jgi:hypothetical protein
MKSIFTPFIIAAAASCVFTSVEAKADLLLTGNLVGIFHPNSDANTTVTNSADGDASFRTGVPVAGSFKSGLDFNGQSFADIASGDTFSLGMLTYYNGITNIGTSSGNAVLDLYLELTNRGMSWVHLTTMTFGIDATVNTFSNLVPDSYTASFTQPSEIWIGSEWVKFTIDGIPAVTSLAENTWATVGNVTLTEGNSTPVPETGASGLYLGLALVGLAGHAAFRRGRAYGNARAFSV